MPRLQLIIPSTVLLFLIMASTPLAQPQSLWMSHFDAGNHEAFFDVYAASDSSYVAAGGSSRVFIYGGLFFIVKLDKNGQRIWSQTYGDYAEGAMIRSIIETDNGDFVAAGQSAQFGGNVDIIRINADGEQIWRRQYMLGDSRAIIELKGGEFLICGQSEGQGYLLMLDDEGDEIWTRNYPISDQDRNYGVFTSMRELDREVIVSGEGTIGQGGSYHPWLNRIDLENNGDVVWETHLQVGELANCNTIISCQGGYVISGMTNGVSTYLMKVNNDGEELWERIFENQLEVEQGFCLTGIDRGGFGIAGQARENNGNAYMPYVILTSDIGEEVGRSYHDFSNGQGFQSGVTAFYSIVMGLDNSLVAAGNINTIPSGYDGLVMKWEEEHVGPYFVSWTPEDTLLTILPNDTIQFAVHARHQWAEQFDIDWWVDEGDTISNDTTVTIRFEELGEFIVYCSISDENVSATRRWHVNTVEFYLRSFLPDTTNITTRRNTPIDLTLDVAFVDGIELEYTWSQTGRIENHEFPNEDSIHVNYDLTGDYRILAQITDGQRVIENDWNISIVSSLWWWWPHELQMEVPNDTTMDFFLFPFNQESDSLNYLWLHNGDILSRNEEENITFEELGDHLIQGFLWDGAEVDSVSWSISSVLRDEVDSGLNTELPDRVELFAPKPNPFNSTTIVTYQIPINQSIKLRLFDIRGREIAELVNGWKTSGKHDISINSDKLAAGIYFVGLNAGVEYKIQKVVLVK